MTHGAKAAIFSKSVLLLLVQPRILKDRVDVYGDNAGVIALAKIPLPPPLR